MNLADERIEKDTRRVMSVLQQHVGESHAIRLPELCKQTNLGDRGARRILESLAVDYGVPIGSYSSKAGRWIIADENERRHVLRELYSRRGAINARIYSIERAHLPTLTLTAVQPTLFEKGTE
jgi:hypothetical protein